MKNKFILVILLIFGLSACTSNEQAVAVLPEEQLQESELQERNQKLEAELNALRVEKQEISRQLDSVLAAITEAEETLLTYEKLLANVEFLKATDSENADILGTRYLANAGAVSYVLPLESSVFQSQIQPDEYSVLLPEAVVVDYIKDEASGEFFREKWVLVSWDSETVGSSDNAGWMKLDSLLKYVEGGMYVLAFKSNEKYALTYDVVGKVAEEIEQLMHAWKYGIYELQDFIHVFQIDEVVEQENRYVVHVTAKGEIIRKPEDDPIVIGMYRGKEQLSTQEERDVAQNVIDGFLREISPLGEEDIFNYQIILLYEGIDKYDLLYSYSHDGMVTEMPLEEYFAKEDIEKRIQEGEELLKQYMK